MRDYERLSGLRVIYVQGGSCAEWGRLSRSGVAYCLDLIAVSHASLCLTETFLSSEERLRGKALSSN